MDSHNKIVLVEDTPAHAELIIKIMTHCHYDVEWKKTGNEAIAYALKYPPQLFLIDLALPDMTGMDVLKHLREKLPFSIPMIAVSAHSIVGTREEVLSFGFNDYLSKPFKVNELIDKVKKYIPEIS